MPNLAVEVRRLHDINKSGWWLLLNVTLVGYILIVGYWAVKKSDEGENKFGPNPYNDNENSTLENKSIKPVPNWLLLFSILFSFVIVADIIYVNLMSIGIIPSSEVRQTNKISVYEKNQLIDSGIIWEDESIRYLYSKGNFSVTDNGYILTSDSLIVYSKNDNNEVQVNKITYNNIKDIELDIIANQTVHIVTSKQDSIQEDIILYLSNDNYWDSYFIRELKQQLP